MSDYAPLHLLLRVDGPAVQRHRLPLSELERIVKQLRLTLRDVATVLTDYGPSGQGGRVGRAIEAASDLRVVGSPTAGSFCLDLEVPTPPPEQETLDVGECGHLSERTVETFISGLSALHDELSQLPLGFDRGVLKAIKPFRTALRHGIASIDLTTERNGRRLGGSRIDAEKIDIAVRLIQKPIRAHATAQGMLQMVDFGSLECRIDRAPLSSVSCFFQEKDRDAMHAAVRQFVRVVGEGEFVPGQEHPNRIAVSKLDVIYEPLTLESRAYWNERSVGELAQERAARAFTLPPQIDDDPWRDDEEAAALIAAIHRTD